MYSVYKDLVDQFLKDDQQYQHFYSSKQAYSFLENFVSFLSISNISPSKLTSLNPREIIAYIISLKDKVWCSDEELEHILRLLIRFMYYVCHHDGEGNSYTCHEGSAVYFMRKAIG